MLLKKNDSMDFMEVDDGNVVVFDAESGNTHFIDEIGLDILHLLGKETDLDNLVLKLSQMYDATVDDIKTDVTDFIDDLLAKKVVVEL